jgi:hypothetical protein
MGFVALLREYLIEQQFYSWGWRVPFLTSIVMGSFGAYLRSFLKESKKFVQNEAKEHQHDRSTGAVIPVTTWDALFLYWPEIISVALIVAFWATGFYTCFIWMAYYTSELMGGGGKDDSVPHAWLINTVMMSLFVGIIPCAGLVADSVCQQVYQGNDVGYRRSMVFGAFVVVIFGMILCCSFIHLALHCHVMFTVS